MNKLHFNEMMIMSALY